MRKIAILFLTIFLVTVMFVGCKDQEPIHTHTFSEKWSSNETHHWKAATCEHSDQTIGKAEHIFSEVTTESDGTKTRECSVCKYKITVTSDKNVPEMIFVNGGTITGALANEIPESESGNTKGVFIEGRTVTLSDFYIGKYEVTQEEYARVMAGQTLTVGDVEYELKSNPSVCIENSSEYTLFEGEEPKKRPVENVSWFDAVWYCNALSKKEGLTPAYNIEVTEVNPTDGIEPVSIFKATVELVPNADGYRLPTEAEWEYAARGGDTTKADWNYLFSGSDKASGTDYADEINSGLDIVGWYCYNNITGETGDTDVTEDASGRGTHQVGKKSPNRLGIYDMSGNVSEWCYDWYAPINTGIEKNPTGSQTGYTRIFRGGSWLYEAYYSSASYRRENGPQIKQDNLGFRVARSCPNTTE